MVLVICHHIFVMQSGYQEGRQYIFTVITLVFIMTQLIHEAIQVKIETVNYLKSPFNIVQTFTILLNLLCMGFGIFMSEEFLMSADGIIFSVVLPSIGAFLLVI